MYISIVAMESSGYVYPMYRALRESGMNVLVAHPKKTRLIAEDRLKNDRGDSMCLAELAGLDALPTSYIPTDEVAVVRRKGGKVAMVALARRLLGSCYAMLRGGKPLIGHGRAY